jgi:hypothetical protein
MSSVNITTLNENYSLEFKRKLKERIEKLTEREHIEKIKQLIFKHNPDLSYTQNSSGVLLFFHNLTYETYSKLDSYLKKIDNDKFKKITMTMTDEEPIPHHSQLTDTINQSIIRLSSLEKNIIKKKDYYEKLKEENNVDTDIIYKSDDEDMDIFLNKDLSSPSPIENSKTSKTSKTPTSKAPTSKATTPKAPTSKAPTSKATAPTKTGISQPTKNATKNATNSTLKNKK